MRLVEHGQIISGFVPVDLKTANNVGDWISMKNYNHVTIIIFHGIGTDNEDIIITLDQSTDVTNSQSDSKTLDLTEFYHKIGDTALSAVSEFTRVTQTAADGVDTDSLDEAQKEALYVIEIDRTQLDADNGFDCLKLDVADVGSGAMLGCCLYILTEPRYTGAEAIAD